MEQVCLQACGVCLFSQTKCLMNREFTSPARVFFWEVYSRLNRSQAWVPATTFLRAVEVIVLYPSCRRLAAGELRCAY
jgi:hypothetical protein